MSKTHAKTAAAWKKVIHRRGARPAGCDFESQPGNPLARYATADFSSFPVAASRRVTHITAASATNSTPVPASKA